MAIIKYLEISGWKCPPRGSDTNYGIYDQLSVFFKFNIGDYYGYDAESGEFTVRIHKDEDTYHDADDYLAEDVEFIYRFYWIICQTMYKCIIRACCKTNSFLVRK